ncbi:MAG TPA: hypothetical protein VEP69_00395 [Thermodesulfovibrionales bacterium]|nr:hypothetical protein [Thermodesulfovibrionales bacterium]
MEEFRICVNCSYAKGFQVSFKKTPAGKVRIILVCPDCGQAYDIGWSTSAIKTFKADKGLIY